MSGETTPRRALAIQHFASGGLGNFERVLVEHGYQVTVIQASPATIAAVDPHDFDIVVVLGSNDGVYEGHDYIAPEIAFVKERLAAKRPTFGVCFGAQVMASALGKKVYAGEHREIGYRDIRPNTDGLASPIRHFAGVPVAEWHGDTFELPEGVTLLASSDAYSNEAFSIGSHALAVQFHPELTPEMHGAWVAESQEELREHGISNEELDTERAEYAANAQDASRAMLSEWLEDLER